MSNAFLFEESRDGLIPVKTFRNLGSFFYQPVDLTQPLNWLFDVGRSPLLGVRRFYAKFIEDSGDIGVAP